MTWEDSLPHRVPDCQGLPQSIAGKKEPANPKP